MSTTCFVPAYVVFFVVTGYEEVAEFFSRWPRTSRGAQQVLYTGDFSTMYTTIPHRDLLQSLREVTKEAWDWEVECRGGRDSERVVASKLLLQRTSEGVEWVYSARGSSSHSAKAHRATLDELNSLIKFLVGNIYVVNGNTCRKQVIGIPMGTNCAPALANLYLYAYESAFIDRLMACDVRTARNCHMTFRLIDDVLSVDNPRMQRLTDDYAENGGLYPRALRLNDTTISRGEVQFLGMRLRSARNGLQLTVFDKRSEFPFAVRRYPHMCSLIPAYIPYGVFTGQLHRYYRSCLRILWLTLRCLLKPCDGKAARCNACDRRSTRLLRPGSDCAGTFQCLRCALDSCQHWGACRKPS